jgi:hypothetical protein
MNSIGLITMKKAAENTLLKNHDYATITNKTRDHEKTPCWGGLKCLGY